MEREALILGGRNSWLGNAVYGFAHFGKSLFWYSGELLFAYFLTEFVGLTAVQMGLILAAGFLVSAVVDVMTGTLFRSTLSNPRSASRLQLSGAIACSFSLILVFLGAWLPTDVRFVYSLVAGLCFRLSFALYDVPQNALMALATNDFASRQRLASIRIWFSGIATLVAAAMVGPLVNLHRSESGPFFVFWLSTLFAIMATASAWRLNQLLRDYDVDEIMSPAQDSAKGIRFAEFWLLLFVMLVTALFTPLFTKLEPYFATYVLRSAVWGGVVVISMALGIVAGQPIWLRLSHHIPHGVLMIVTAALQIVGLTAFWLLGASDPLLSAMCAFIFGLGNGGVGMAQWAAFSETVARIGPARAGISYGLFSGIGKLALAIGGLVLAGVLARIDLDGPTASGLVWFMTLLPGIGAICVVFVGLGLLACQRHSKMLRDGD